MRHALPERGKGKLPRTKRDGEGASASTLAACSESRTTDVKWLWLQHLREGSQQKRTLHP